MIYVTPEIENVKCRFGCEGIVGLFHVPQGCMCWTDPVQALCAHHLETAESEGPITILIGNDGASTPSPSIEGTER